MICPICNTYIVKGGRCSRCYPHETYRTPPEPQEWLTKRELFAAMAMMGLARDIQDNTFANLAQEAVKCADALIAELSKEKP